MPRQWVLISVGVLAVVALLVFIWYWRRKPASAVPAQSEKPVNAIAVPPAVAPSRSDKIVASLINNLNSDMRSLEIGHWFFGRLRAQTLARGSDAAVKCADDYFDLRAIADAVPGANDVTKAATVKSLRALVDEAKRPMCGGGAAMGDVQRDVFIATLNKFEASALAPGRGVLLGMPGYTERSRLPLPS
jgi:hypothetical protein